MEHHPESELILRFDRAARPLRRLIARGAAERAATDPWFAASCARLAEDLATVGLPEPLEAEVQGLVAGLRGLGTESSGEARAERMRLAGQVLQRLDDVLGLPLPAREVPLPRRVRRVRLPTEPEAPRAVTGKGAQAAPLAKGAARAAKAPSQAEITRAPVEPAPAPQPVQSALQGARWDTPLEDLDLATELVEAAAAVGVETVGDALTLRPLSVESVAPVHGAGRELPEGRVAVGGRVRARFTWVGPKGRVRSSLVLQGADRLPVGWHRAFTSADLALLPLGQKVVVVGSCAPVAEGVVFTGAESCRAEHGVASIVRYGVGEAESAVDDVVRVLLADVERLEDPYPSRLRERHSLVELRAAVERVHGHGPDEAATRRLAFDEALALQLGVSAARFESSRDRGIAHALAQSAVVELQTRDGLPPLGDAAQAVLERIRRDLKSPAPMQRVVVAPAGSEGDELAMHAILSIGESKNQVLVLASEAPVAAVLYDLWEARLRAQGLQPALFTGEARPADQDALRRGEVHVAFTTPAILEAGLEFRRLGLVVALEQRTYGETAGRIAALRVPRPDLLILVRSPVPASLLLQAWPSLDVSVLPALPTAARGTFWSESDRGAAYLALAERVSAGKPGMIVFPLKRQGDDLFTLREVDALVGTLRAQFFGGARIVTFHGSQSPRERQAAWLDFVERRAQVIVATYPIEGLPILPRATAALIEYGDRLDPQRLLGIRAMVTPEGTVEYVQAAEPDIAGTAFARDLAEGMPDLDMVVRHPSGFLLGEAAAALASTEGTPAWRWLDPSRDLTLLVEAREEAHAQLTADPQLRQGPAVRLARHAQAVWTRLLPERPFALATTPAAAGGRKRRRKKRRR